MIHFEILDDYLGAGPLQRAASMAEAYADALVEAQWYADRCAAEDGATYTYEYGVRRVYIRAGRQYPGPTRYFTVRADPSEPACVGAEHVWLDGGARGGPNASICGTDECRDCGTVRRWRLDVAGETSVSYL